ncbi:VOC family protein [Nocardia sp. alder85J]|uniref:VOC family protein n=1 Tax=Nocardia sp. alder85J TaxID=2862949 RepID=UPI001CD3512F|nr:VOC family protein [Nocardia sp. alder85J]MCX4091498.1 VOC family protein [Nocardia sp. alder85J]
MAVRQVEIGLVSADDVIVDFYALAFGLERIPASESRSGTLHRLQADGISIKVMVPARTPAPADRAAAFLDVTGLRYLTFHVDDLDGALDRAVTAGGAVLHGPLEIGGGRRVVVLRDPDGNTVEVTAGP